MSEHVLVLGGARSGKTAFGEDLAMRYGAKPAFLATAEALDQEMKDRIAAHQRSRARRFDDFEEPLDIGGTMLEAARHHDVILVDCLTVWVSNLLGAERDVTEAVESLAMTLSRLDTARVIMVSNEVGLGIVPDNALARSYRDLMGWTHQRLAGVCSEVHFIIAGLPMTLKGLPIHSR
jgi:adenosylcobinamide kinase / adenosylcobinamide-phosphate guanylyltransferase